jgi:hypothetical protein
MRDAALLAKAKTLTPTTNHNHNHAKHQLQPRGDLSMNNKHMRGFVTLTTT